MFVFLWVERAFLGHSWGNKAHGSAHPADAAGSPNVCLNGTRDAALDAIITRATTTATWDIRSSHELVDPRIYNHTGEPPRYRKARSADGCMVQLCMSSLSVCLERQGWLFLRGLDFWVILLCFIKVVSRFLATVLATLRKHCQTSVPAGIDLDRTLAGHTHTHEQRILET